MTHSMVRPQVDHCLTFLHRWQYLTLKTKTGQNPLFFPTWAYNRNRRRVTVGPRFSSTSPACTAVSISAYEDVTKAHPGITNGLLLIHKPRKPRMVLRDKLWDTHFDCHETNFNFMDKPNIILFNNRRKNKYIKCIWMGFVSWKLLQ